MVRLQKFLADAGIASRRKAEELIVDGKIKVNGRVVTELGTKISEDDRVEYNGKIIKIKSDKIYIALNKPIGYICSASGRQGRSVLDLVDTEERIYPVGRLDKDSRGLIILTNDGEFTNQITHTSHNIEKEYEVSIDKPLDNKDREILERGMILDGQKLRPVSVLSVDDEMVTLVLKQGLNRQIRRMMGQLGYRVSDLRRVRIGKLRLGDLPEGGWKKFNPSDI